MKIHLKQIPHEGAYFEGEDPRDIFQLEDPKIRHLGPVEWALDVGISDGGLWVHGNVSTSFELECVSCLKRFVQKIVVPDFATQVPLEGPEMIDLTEQVREDILLNLPVHPRCDWDGQTPCEGLTTYPSQQADGQKNHQTPTNHTSRPNQTTTTQRSRTDLSEPQTSHSASTHSKPQNSDDGGANGPDENQPRDPRDVWKALDELRLE